MVTSGIPSARRKLARARHHADQLREEVETFREQSPYDFETKSLGNPRGQSDFRVLVKVSESEPIPEFWSLMFGDVLTNARAALDHAVFHHVRAQSPATPPHRIQYPIFDDSQTFATQTSGRFSPAVHQLIEAAQPYKSPDPSGHPLRLLRDLVNVDKHHEVVVTNYAAEALEFASHEMYEVVSPPQVCCASLTVTMSASSMMVMMQ